MYYKAYRVFVSHGMSSRNKVRIHLGRKWSADVLKIQRFGRIVLVQINCVVIRSGSSAIQKC